MRNEVKDKVKDLYNRAMESGGWVSCFGYDVGLGGAASVKTTSTTKFDTVKVNESWSELSIPGENNNYPVLLGVLGRKLQISGH